MNRYKQVKKKKSFLYCDLAKGGKITWILHDFGIVFDLTDDWTYLTKIYFLKKKSETFPRLKKYTSKQKAKHNSIQKFRNNNKNKSDLKACQKLIEKEKIQ